MDKYILANDACTTSSTSILFDKNRITIDKHIDQSTPLSRLTLKARALLKQSIHDLACHLGPHIHPHHTGILDDKAPRASPKEGAILYDFYLILYDFYGFGKPSPNAKSTQIGPTWRGEASWRGVARRGEARRGEAWRDVAWKA